MSGEGLGDLSRRRHRALPPAPSAPRCGRTATPPGPAPRPARTARPCRTRPGRGPVTPSTPGPGLEPEALDDEPGEHEDADDEGDRDRQQRHGQVVEDLPDRLEERPAVGPRHEDAVGGVEQAHPRREEHRQDEDRVPGQDEGGRAGGQHEQGDLRGRVEAQPHEQTDRVEVPGLADPPGHPTQQPGQEAAVVQVVLQLRLVELAAAHPAEDRAMPTAATRFIRPMSTRTFRPRPSRSARGSARPGTPRPGRRRRPSGRCHQQQAGGEDHGGVSEENQKPVLTDGRPSPTSLRVVLSIEAMWSASNACRTPSMYAVRPTPTPRTPVLPSW